MAGVQNRDGMDGTDIFGKLSVYACFGDPSRVSFPNTDFWCICACDGLGIKLLTAFSYCPGPGTSTLILYWALGPQCANG